MTMHIAAKTFEIEAPLLFEFLQGLGRELGTVCRARLAGLGFFSG